MPPAHFQAAECLLFSFCCCLHATKLLAGLPLCLRVPCARRQLEGLELEALENVVEEASEVRMELAAMGSELLEKMARSPHVTKHLSAVRSQSLHIFLQHHVARKSECLPSCTHTPCWFFWRELCAR